MKSPCYSSAIRNLWESEDKGLMNEMPQWGQNSFRSRNKIFILNSQRQKGWLKKPWLTVACLYVWSSATSRNISDILAACWLQTALGYITRKYLDLLRHTFLVLPAVSAGQGEKHTLVPAKQQEPWPQYCAQHSRGKCCFLKPVLLAANIIIIVPIMTAFACDAGKLLPQPLRCCSSKTLWVNANMETSLLSYLCVSS